MKKSPNKTKHGLILLILLLITLALLLTLQRSEKLQSTIETGQFEASYAATIETLQTKTGALRDKLSAAIPGDLEILPDALRRIIKPEKNIESTRENPNIDQITLRGIYWSNSNPFAEINDRLCKIGDEIDGFTLTEVKPYQIVLQDLNGTNHTISIIKKSYSTERIKQTNGKEL